MRLGLQRRLMLALGFLSLLLLAVTATSLLTLNRTVRVGLKEAVFEEEVSQMANEVAISALLSRRYEKDFLLSIESPSERERALHAWDAANQRLTQAIDAFDAATTSDDDRRQIELWRAALRFFLDGFRQATDAIQSGKMTSTLDAFRSLQPVGDNLSTLTEMAISAAELKRGSAREARRRVERLAAQVSWSLAAMGAVALACAVTVSVMFPRRLLRPVDGLRDAATRLAEGDLTARAEVSGIDELGELATRFNRMAETIEQRTAELRAQYEAAESARAEAESAKSQIAEQLATIRSQKTLIGDLSVPILPLDEATLVAPLVGELDAERLAIAQERVLNAIERAGARYLILDITAVPVVDTRVADGLFRLVRAVELLGSNVVLVGIRPDVASSLVELGVDLSRITTHRSLRSGVAYVAGRPRRGVALRG